MIGIAVGLLFAHSQMDEISRLSSLSRDILWEKEFAVSAFSNLLLPFPNEMILKGLAIIFGWPSITANRGGKLKIVDQMFRDR